MPTHGGDFAPVNTVIPEIAREIDAKVVALTDLDEMMTLMNKGLREAGVSYEEPVVHSGATETTIVLAVRDDRDTRGIAALGTVTYHHPAASQDRYRGLHPERYF